MNYQKKILTKQFKGETKVKWKLLNVTTDNVNVIDPDFKSPKYIFLRNLAIYFISLLLSFVKLINLCLLSCDYIKWYLQSTIVMFKCINPCNRSCRTYSRWPNKYNKYVIWWSGQLSKLNVHKKKGKTHEMGSYVEETKQEKQLFLLYCSHSFLMTTNGQRFEMLT